MINIITFFSIIIADQISKNLLINNLSFGDSIPIISNVFHITLIYNTGIAFGLFKNKAVILSVFSFFVIAFIIINILEHRKKGNASHIEAFALYIILAGAMGNLIDRFRFGYVIDFLDFRIWPVFNIADSAITIGMVLLLIRCFRLFAK